MKPERNSQRLLSITRSKAKMYEYSVAIEDHIDIPRDPIQLLPLAIGILGDLAAEINSVNSDTIDFNEQEKDLQFSAQFFDSYLNSRLNEQLNPYILLLGAASYYLCNLPGSSIVLTRLLGETKVNLDAQGLEELLFWILKVSDISSSGPILLNNDSGVFGSLIQEISSAFLSYYRDGQQENKLFESLELLRDTAYLNGTPRQLLFVDVACALIRKRHQNSTWACLPKYSRLSVDLWRSTLKKPSFIHELWPAQHLLGDGGVFAGNSAVIQMPTSAGKTKAIEIIIRSAFLSRRASTVVVIAPFRALCHEISAGLTLAFSGESVHVDEFSDVLQVDFQTTENTAGQQIWVVTPEKLLYILRQEPEVAAQIGLLIYDEAHQFDNGIRGVTYELLLTSLRKLVPKQAQVILISAVINNAEQVKQWLVPNAKVIIGLDLIPTFRTVAFTTWLDQRGRLEFVTPTQPGQSEFFVPRVLEEHELERKPREQKPRVFPSRDDGRAIALYLGLKLTSKGSVAIFCGTKPAVVRCTEQIVDIYSRNLPIPKPIDFSDRDEVEKLARLHELNLGDQSSVTQSARIGVFSHHSNIPHGIRLAVEYALKENLIKFVICTSTLAQGVNLPIRYLILSSFYQAGERIKVRDFHNLIGRAGRSGIHTEGSIIFADPTLFPDRLENTPMWRQVTELLLPENSEPCLSTLLSLFEPLKSDNGRYILDIDILELVRLYITGNQVLENFIDANANDLFTEENLRSQITYKKDIIAAIESYLLAYWDGSEFEGSQNSVSELATGTFAYFLADDQQEVNLVQCFKLLAENMQQRIPQENKRMVFGRTLYGVWTSIGIETWVRENIDALLGCNNQEEMLEVLWPLLERYIVNSNFKKCDPPDALKSVALQWIGGQPYHAIFKDLNDKAVRLRARSQRRAIHIETVVDICENAFSYEGGLVLNAIIEIIGLFENSENGELVHNLQVLQKRLKYGLPSQSEIVLHEIGFADRVIAIELSQIINYVPIRKLELVSILRTQQDRLREKIAEYPSYFAKQFENILNYSTFQ